METTVLWTVAGVLVGGFITWWVTKHYSPPQRLCIGLEPSYIVNPREVGLGGHLGLTYDVKPIPMLVAYRLTLTNKGNADINFASPDAVGKAANPQPKLAFENFHLIGCTTPNPNDALFYIPLAISDIGRSVYIHLKRLKAHTTAEFLLLGYPENSNDATRVSVQQDFVPNFTVVFTGMLG